MTWTQRVTILVTSILGLAVVESSQADPVSLSMRMAGQGRLVQTATPNAALAASLDYAFYKSYLIGVEYSYLRPFTNFQDYVHNGVNDVAFYLGDKELWSDKHLGLNLSARFGGILPTSNSSKEASMRYGLTAGATLKKTFTQRFSMTYKLIYEDYDHQYATAEESEKSIVYNTRWDLINRFGLSYKITKSVRVDSAFAVFVFNDYNDVTYDTFQLSTGLTWEFSKFASLDMGFRTSMRDANGVGTYNGGSMAEQFFDPTGTSLYVGANIDI